MKKQADKLAAWPTIADVAVRLDVGEAAVRAMISRGSLRAEHWFDGRIYRKKVDPASLAEFMATRRRLGPGQRGGVKWVRKRATSARLG